MSLRREVGFLGASAYGTGVILGAGIYALVGRTAGEAGGAVWASFLIGSVVAATTGLSYAELASMYPSAAAEYVYVRRAYGSGWLAFLVGWSMLFAQLLAAATVALGFAGYFGVFFPVPAHVAAVLLLAILSALVFWGTKESVQVGVLFLIAEAGGLFAVIAVGLPGVASVNLMETPNGLAGILSAAALAFFAFIGFENIANLAEETVNPQRVIPRAIIFSILVCTVLYVLVALSAIAMVDWRVLARSTAPLADAISARIGSGAGAGLAFVALAATANTVLAVLVTSSRILYGMGSQSVLPRIFAALTKRRRAPYLGIIAAFVLASVFAATGDIGRLANMTSFGALFAFTLVNASVARLRITQPNAKRPFRIPLSVARIPVPSAIGVVACVILMARSDPVDIALGSPFIAAGLAVYAIHRRRYGPGHDRP